MTIENVSYEAFLHAPEHMASGSDPVRLDELKAPTDVTTLNVSSTAHGLQPKHPNDATKFLSGAATYLALDQLHLALNVGALTPGATGVVSGKKFAVLFLSVGAELWEIARTPAM